MSDLFTNQECGAPYYKHNQLPIYQAKSFDFFRIIPFEDSFYGRSVIDLHKGNLRMNKEGNRYSNFLPGQKVSYWSDSVRTARAEYYHWYKSKNYISFWAYDDGSSVIPTIYPPEPLYIVDGRDKGINQIINKRNRGQKLEKSERDLVDFIAYEMPDCLVYESKQKIGGLNYLFFERGFKKLSLRQVKLRLGDDPSCNQNIISCAKGNDYTPYLKGYCGMFLPKAKIRYDDKAANSEEIRMKIQVIIDWSQRV